MPFLVDGSTQTSQYIVCREEAGNVIRVMTIQRGNMDAPETSPRLASIFRFAVFLDYRGTASEEPLAIVTTPYRFTVDKSKISKGLHTLTAIMLDWTGTLPMGIDRYKPHAMYWLVD